MFHSPSGFEYVEVSEIWKSFPTKDTNETDSGELYRSRTVIFPRFGYAFDSSEH